MRNLISIVEVANQPGYVIEDAGWKRLQALGDQAVAEYVDCLARLIEFLNGLPGEAPAPVAERSCLPRPRPCPAYYRIEPCVEAGQLAQNLSYHVGTALVYCLRAGRKPGATAEEDCRKGADHLLMEADRLRLLEQRRHAV